MGEQIPAESHLAAYVAPVLTVIGSKSRRAHRLSPQLVELRLEMA